MPNRTRCMLVALATALALSLMTGAATALRSLSLNPVPRSWTLTQRGVAFRSELGEVICNLTLRKGTPGIFPKRAGTMVGEIFGFFTEACRGNGVIESPRVVPLNVEPELWKMVYTAILGTLPRITGIKFQIREFLLLFEMLVLGAVTRCLYRGPVEELATVTEGVIGRLRFTRESRRLTLSPERLNNEICPRTGEIIAESLEPEQVIRVSLV
jgi:hypothetical protein